MGSPRMKELAHFVCVSVLWSWWGWQDKGREDLNPCKAQATKKNVHSSRVLEFQAALFERKIGNQIKCLLFPGWLLEWIWKVCAFLGSADQQWQCICREPDHSRHYHSGKYGELGGLSVKQDFCFLKSSIQPGGKTSSSNSGNFQHVNLGTFWNILPWWRKNVIFKKTKNREFTTVLDVIILLNKGFLDGSVVRNLPAHAGHLSLIPGLGRFPGEGNGNPPQYSFLGNPMDRGTWWATVHRVAKSQIWLSN